MASAEHGLFFPLCFFAFCVSKKHSRLRCQHMRSTYQGRVVFSLYPGRKQPSVLKSDPSVELEAKRFAVKWPHRVFESVEQTWQLDVGPIQNRHDLSSDRC